MLTLSVMAVAFVHREKITMLYNEMFNNIKYAKELEYIKLPFIFDKKR